MNWRIITECLYINVSIKWIGSNSLLELRDCIVKLSNYNFSSFNVSHAFLKRNATQITIDSESEFLGDVRPIKGILFNFLRRWNILEEIQL